MDGTFTPPGPGHWDLDRSHFPGGTTPIMQWLMTESVETAFGKLWPEFGIAAETLSMRFVHGFAYTRVRPLIAPDKPSRRPPPALVLKIVTRLHPEFRRRTEAAARTLASSPAPAVIEEWHRVIRPRLVARNLEMQDVDVAGLDDDTLAAHLDLLLRYIRETFEEHFRLHGYDLGPIGQLVRAGADWGIPGADMVPALAGASPSTAAPLEALAMIRAGLAEAGVEPASLDEVRAASPEVARELDDYLRHRGSVLFAGYDLDTPTLGEAPDVVLATILTDSRDRVFDVEAHRRVVESLRGRVPEADRARFDDLLARARDAMDLRDDNGPITAEWPAGLLRLAMLEAGWRLAGRGRLQEPEHVFELDRHELVSMTRSGDGPDAGTVGRRAEQRAWEKTLDPPRTLGEPEAPPPLDALPEPLAETIRLVQTVIAELGMSDVPEPRGDTPRLDGTGVGREPIVGRACVALTAEEAFDVLDPGDILVTRTTSPAYNMVLTLVGGLVTAEGGPMSHAAVLSRELNIPAVVGALDALEAIRPGDTIEVDPVAGTVRVMTRA